MRNLPFFFHFIIQMGEEADKNSNFCLALRIKRGKIPDMFPK